ncbi:MAG: HlyC/CorC family transporter [Clostridia bacterium]|nr:HlyC/CorC family transporter [Clostridia bacterium]
MADLFLYLAIAALICCSAFFSGTEIAFASVNTLRLKNAADQGSRSAQIAYAICTHYDRALCTILIGNNLVNIAASSIATVIAIRLFGVGGTVYATLAMTVLILIFGEIFPKILAKEHCDGFVSHTAAPLHLLMVLTGPLVTGITRLIDRISALWGGTPDPTPITADELVTMIETVEDEGVIDEERSDLLQSAVGFGETTVEEILTPRVDLTAIDLQKSRDEILKIMEESPFSRIPVYDEDLDSVKGILYLNHAYRVLAASPDAPIETLIMPAFFLHKSTRLPVALRELRSRHLQMAVVRDDFGGNCGVVTLEDILEELVGDIWDESDPIENELQALDDTHFRVSGSMNLNDLLWELDLEQYENTFDSATVGGWITELQGDFPAVGDHIRWHNLDVIVEALDELRVTRILIELLPKEAEDVDEREKTP